MKQDVIDFLTGTLGLDASETPEFYDTFMSSFKQCMDELVAARPITDFMEIRRITHTLIGFSQNVGAMDLFESSRTLNAAAKALDIPACEAAADELLNLYSAYLLEQ